MDTLTHAISGALLAAATAPARRRPGEPGLRTRTAAGFLAAAFPDADFALRFIDTLTYLNWHQGVTHSIVLLPLWALGLAWLLARVTRQPSWPAFIAPVALGIAVHIGGDVLTAYGTALFAPLSWQRFSLPLVFVIDPYLTLLLLAGLAAVLLRPARRAPAVITLLVLAGYLGLLAWLQQQALAAGHDYARAAQLPAATVHALPQPLSPFNWKIIVSHDDERDEAFVNLWRRHAPAPAAADGGLWRRLAAGYRPVATVRWQRHSRFGTEQPALAREAWQHEGFATFRRFARWPVFEEIESVPGAVCAWFYDLRFSLPGLEPSFRYGMCRSEGGGDWILRRRRGDFAIE